VIPPILTPRLALVSLSPQFLRASLAGQLDAAAALLGAELPLEWPRGHEPLLQRRLTQLEADPTAQPWLLRGIVLRDPTGPAPQDLPAGKRLPSGECGPALAMVSPHAPRDPPEGKSPPSGEGGPALPKVRPLVGLIGFHDPPDATGMLEVGYRIEAPYRRHGYATEAVRALFAWATRTEGIERFKASISPTNEASLRLISKLGFQQTGHQWDELDGLELVFERHRQTPRPYTSDEDTA
jgi:GNAT superfamily N-acetyltransferase